MLESITDLCREVPDHLRCRHIFDDGHRCGSYALRSEHHCYYHHAERKPVPDPQARYARRNPITLPSPTSRAAIQQAIGTIITNLASNNIDRRRAGTLLYGLQLAALNIARHREDNTHTNEPSSPQDSAPTQQDSASTPSDCSSTPANPDPSPANSDPSPMSHHPSPVSHPPLFSCHPSPQAEDLRLPQPAANATAHQHQTDPFTEEVFPLPEPKLHRLERPYFALLLNALAQHLHIEPSPGSPEDRQPETSETILPNVHAVAEVEPMLTRAPLPQVCWCAGWKSELNSEVGNEAGCVAGFAGVCGRTGGSGAGVAFADDVRDGD